MPFAGDFQRIGGERHDEVVALDVDEALQGFVEGRHARDDTPRGMRRQCRYGRMAALAPTPHTPLACARGVRGRRSRPTRNGVDVLGARRIAMP